MGDDPTLDFLSRLNDESKWVIRRNVPVFEPHTRSAPGPDGKPKKITVTTADLPEIAERSNKLETDSGVVGLLTDKHTIRPRADGAGMEPTPDVKIYGVQRNYRVGTYGPDQKPAVLCDWYILPEMADEATKRPHRSVEYQSGAKVIRGSAVMANAPFLDMGMVMFGQHADGKEELYLYAMGATMGPTDASLPDAKGDGKDGLHKDGHSAPMHTPEEEKLFEKMRGYMCSKYGLPEEWPASKEKKEGDGEPDTAGKPHEKGKEPVTPMSTDKNIQLYQELNAKIAGLEAEREVERCQTLLYALETEGYSLSADEKKKELAKLIKTPAGDRPERASELRAIYANRKVPQGRLELFAGPVEGGTEAGEGDPFKKPWYFADAMQYMLDNPGTTYEKAVTVIKDRSAKK